MEKTYDIDSKVQFAIDWVFATYGCKGCENGTKHDPICLLGHNIAVSRGAHGKIVIINPHPSVLDLPLQQINTPQSPSAIAEIKTCGDCSSRYLTNDGCPYCEIVGLRAENTKMREKVKNRQLRSNGFYQRIENQLATFLENEKNLTPKVIAHYIVSEIIPESFYDSSPTL